MSADRGLDAGLDQRLAMAGVSVDRPDALAAEPPHGLQVELDHDRLELVLPQQPGQGLAHGPIADHDGPVSPGLVRHVRRWPRSVRPRRLDEPPERAFERIDQPIVEGVERDGDDCRRRRACSVAFSSRMPSPLPADARMNENSPIWAEGDGDRDGDPEGYARSSRTTPARRGACRPGRWQSVAATRPGDASRERGLKRMPTETKNSTAKASRMGSASVAALRLNSDRPTTIPARKAPEGHRNPEELGRTHRDAQGEDEHRQHEELPRPRPGHAVEDPGEEPLAEQECQERPWRRP